jgi:glycosyltransferase involved in cell wall biosynthesis
MNICIVYLGSKGGGARLTRDLYEDLSYSHHQVRVIYKHNAEFSEHYEIPNNENLSIHFPSSKILMYIFAWYYARRLVNQIKMISPKVNCLVFSMPHPYNKYLLKGINKKVDAITISIIHDDKAHLGELWPTKFVTKQIISRSRFVVYLSKHVMSKFPYAEKSKHTTLESLPILQFPYPVRDKKVIVVPGRLKKYKNIDRILEISENLPDGYIIKIVGEGDLTFSPKKRNIHVVNRWLSSLEFDHEIAAAGALLNLYVEATQSGPVAIAKVYGTPVISNFIGGIGEQLENYAGAFFAKPEIGLTNEILNGINLFDNGRLAPKEFPQMDITKKILCILEDC